MKMIISDNIEVFLKVDLYENDPKELKNTYD